METSKFVSRSSEYQILQPATEMSDTVEVKGNVDGNIKVDGKSLAKVIVLSKDEYDLIEDFICHHGRIFGYENIVIVDNGSSDPRVLDVYRKYRELGVTIESDSERSMLNMAQIVTDAMRRHAPSCHFLVPLDTDEFIWTPGSEEMDAHRVREHLEDILSNKDEVSVIRYKCFLGSVADASNMDYIGHKHLRPARSITTFYDQGWDKLIVRSERFVSILQGNHHVHVQKGTTMTSHLLGLLHFHETGAARKLERCMMSMEGYKQVSLKDHLQKSLDDKIIECDRLVSQKLFGGHRIEQYREMLRREKVCRVYAHLVGALPSSATAVEIAKNPHAWASPQALNAFILMQVDMSLWRNIGQVSAHSTLSASDISDIVMQEQPPSELIRVTQVADLLKSF